MTAAASIYHQHSYPVWEDPAIVPSIGDGEVHVWLANIAGEVPLALLEAL